MPQNIIRMLKSIVLIFDKFKILLPPYKMRAIIDLFVYLLNINLDVVREANR